MKPAPIKTFVALALCSLSVLIAPFSPVARANDFVNKKAADAYYREQVRAPLREAGLNPDSFQDLLTALERNDLAGVGIQLSAIELLQERHERDALPALRKALTRQTLNFVKLTICQALQGIGDDNSAWTPTCLALLNDKDPATQLEAAGLLAKARDAHGWPIVVSHLKDADSTLSWFAAQAAPDFDGLELVTDEANPKTKIDVLSALVQAFPQSVGTTQTNLIVDIAKLVKAKDRPLVKQLIQNLAPENLSYNKDLLQRLLTNWDIQKQIDILEGMLDTPGANNQVILEVIADFKKRIADNVL